MPTLADTASDLLMQPSVEMHDLHSVARQNYIPVQQKLKQT